MGSWAIGGLLALVAVLGVLAIGRGGGGEQALSPRSHGRLGTSALVALARDLGADVAVRDSLPRLAGAGAPDVLLVFADRFTTGQHQTVDGWVRAGGVLVVTDPVSGFSPQVGGLGFDDVDELGPTVPGDCGIAPLSNLDLARVDPDGGGLLYALPAEGEGCLDDTRGDAYIVATPRGEGTVVAIGGSGMAVNEALAHGQNAPVMAALVAPREGTGLVVLEPGAVSGGAASVGERTLRDLVSPGVKRGLAQLAVAFVVYALWRARRLGRPVREPQPVAVAASELVAAVGSLLDRSGSPQHAADLLRRDLRRFLADRAGVPASLDDDVLARVVAERTGVSADQLRLALGAQPVTDDAGLMDLAHTIDHIREEVLAHV
jgi:hypothetical protein